MKTTHSKWLQLVMVGMIAISLAACGGSNRPDDARIVLPDGAGDNGGDENPREEGFCEDPTQLFVLDGIVPRDGATGVPPNISSVVRFNEPVAEASVNETTLFLTANGAPVPVTYTIIGRTVTLTPDMNLAANTPHTLTIGPELRAAECEDPLPAKFLAEGEAGDRTFTTGGDVDNGQPRVEAINPADGASLVSTGAPIIITFSEPVQPATVNGSTVTVTRRDNGQIIAGTFDVNAEVVTFQPDAALTMQENYDVAITTNIRDLAGNSLKHRSIANSALAVWLCCSMMN